MVNSNFVWLAADYHFPSLYSCRVPMSSMSSVLAMPAPGPATVRLALIKTGIELFGVKYVKEKLFQHICTAETCIRPPEKVAISNQILRAYKWNAGKSGKEDWIQESVIYREFAHPQGELTIFMAVPAQMEDEFRQLFKAIGYWGQRDSLAYCTNVYEASPESGEYAVPLSNSLLMPGLQLRPFFTCFTTEFRNTEIKWEEIVPGPDSTNESAIKVQVYLWPMLIYRHDSSGTILHRHSFNS